MNTNILTTEDLKIITGVKDPNAIQKRLIEMDIPFKRIGGIITTSLQAYNESLGLDLSIENSDDKIEIS